MGGFPDVSNIDGIGPIGSLAAGSIAVANGTAIPLGRPFNNVSLVVQTTGTITGGVIVIQGSVDGVNWFNMGAGITLTAAGTFQFTSVSAPIPFIRAAITTAVTGGGSIAASLMAI